MAVTSILLNSGFICSECTVKHILTENCAEKLTEIRKNRNFSVEEYAGP